MAEHGPGEAAALDALDAAAMIEDLSRFIQIPSVTGHERPAAEALIEMSRAQGLRSELKEYDLAASVAGFGRPPSTWPRDELVGVATTLPGSSGASQRLCINAHLDVVEPGTSPWRFGPWSGHVEDGNIYGRGTVDVKVGLVAAVHALGAVRAAHGAAPAEVVLQAVPSEEDGGLGTFAALQDDAAFDACLVAEPTALDVVAAHPGVIQFSAALTGRAAHGAYRLEGLSAFGRFVEAYRAAERYEAHINEDIQHPLMRGLELPYPVSIGTISGGNGPSAVPDYVAFAGRIGVRIGETRDEALDAFKRAIEDALDVSDGPLELTWTGAFEAAATDPDHPFVQLVQSCAADELQRSVPVVAVKWGADMWQYCERGIPCVMFGAADPRLAHAVDEHVPVANVVHHARALVRLISRFGDRSEAGAR